MAAFAVLLSAPFRPFFLAAAAHSVLAMLAWLAFLLWGVPLTGAAADPFLWHGHTMIGGFASAVIAGFLLTAAANWTGRQTTTPPVLFVLVALWLIGRLADFVPDMPAIAPLIADGGFWLLTVALLLRVVVATRNWRNLGFALLPLAFGSVDIAWHLDHGRMVAGIARPALWTAVDLLTLIMGAMGGRIVPFFTERRLAGVHIRNPKMLGIAANAVLVAVLLMNLGWRSTPVSAWFMLLGGVLLLARLAGWNSAATRREPMLWILHWGYAWLGVGLMLRAFAVLTGAYTEAGALHAITAGALGSLGLGMLVRVALGHTGRTIEAHPSIAIAFLLIAAAGVVRILSLADAPSWIAFGLSSVLWISAFGIYLWRFVPILIAPRA